MKIGIFCSANNQIDPDFFAATEALGHWCGENGHTVVFGGCSMGLMESIGHSAKEAGSTVIGVVPTIIEERGRESRHLDVTIPCDNLSDRKSLMMDQSDVFVALPGGLGTLDEVFTVVASATIGYHHKLTILYNMKGYWNSVVAMLDDLQAQGMVRGHWTDHIHVVGSLDELAAELTSL